MAETPDFEVVTERLEHRLRERGLEPQRSESGLETGLSGLRLERGEISVATSEGMPFFADVEIDAVLRHPALGQYTVSDRVTLDAPTAAETLAFCADTYVDATFPAIHALFDEERSGASKLEFERAGRGRAAASWRAFHGPIHVVDDATGEVLEYFRRAFAGSLVEQSLMTILDGPSRLHWCKLYGARTARGLDFGCSIDGRKSRDAEAEMKRRLPGDLASGGKWEFRFFMTCIPSTAAGEPSVAAARAEGASTNADQRAPAPKRSWWPFGR